MLWVSSDVKVSQVRYHREIAAMPCRPRFVPLILMLAGCTPGLVLEEVDSVIESALPSTSLAEEPSDTPVELEESLSESSPNSTGDSPVDGNALNYDEPGEP